MLRVFDIKLYDKRFPCDEINDALTRCDIKADQIINIETQSEYVRVWYRG